MTAPEPNVIARFTFKPECASDFLLEEDIEAGRLVQEFDTYTLDEAAEFVQTFASSLVDAQIWVNPVREGSQRPPGVKSVVVSMSDFIEEADEADLIDW